MNKKKLLENIVRRIIKEEIDPKANAAANSLLLMDRLKNNPQFMKMIQEIQLPTDKYEAILHFANLLGIPEERFEDFMKNVKIQTKEYV